MSSGLFSINRICQLTGISKNTYYNHKDKEDKFENKYSHLKAKVKQIIQDNSAYGVKRIKQELFNKYKVEVGRDALLRLLKLLRLGLARKIKKKKPSVIKEILDKLADRVNLLIRTKLDSPFQAISSDITEIIYNQGKNKAYLAVHKDVLGQMVYGYSLKRTMEAQLVIDSFKMAVKTIKKLLKRLPRELICHSDQGTQYTSYDYVDKVLKTGITLSYSTPATPTENPGQESFFGRFKDENKDLFYEIKDFEKLKKIIIKSLGYYNNKRLHTSLKLESPKKYTLQFIKNFPR